MADLRRPESALVQNLQNFTSLDGDDLLEIRLIVQNAQNVRHNQIIFHERHRCDHVALILEGMACRYKVLSDGRRQILGYLIPGDLCDSSFLLSDVSDYGVVALGNARIATPSIDQFAELLRVRPNIARAMSLIGLRDMVMLREWLLNVGRRNAFQRLCHFFCEISVRMKAIGETGPEDTIVLPINQAALADTIGLTEVHVNRTLQRLRASALINFHGRQLQILDFPKLAELAEFDDHYLGLRTMSRVTR